MEQEMQIFKFGGASLKTANAVRNMIEIVCRNSSLPLVIVVSAMGKTTNALEEIFELKRSGEEYRDKLKLLEKYHSNICSELFINPEHHIFRSLDELFESLQEQLNGSIENENIDFWYDQIISHGELLSSTIIADALNQSEVNCSLLDARALVKTDDCHKEGKVLWDHTEDNIQSAIESNEDHTVYLTQGFIGSTLEGKTTTLGREGSDFTAAIFAAAMGASSVTFWKDVPGIMNADPKLVSDAVLLKHLPYQEAAEMTYYGAKVIHPKTIRPLANKNIPLFVKGFDHPDHEGTSIRQLETWERMPIIIYKHNQCIVSCKFTDFSFVNEESLVRIFDVLHEMDIKVNMMQNSAISFSVCIDYKQKVNDQLIKKLAEDFNVHYNTDLTLVTIKNYTSEALDKYRPTSNILMEQQTRANFQAVVNAIDR